MAKYQVDSSSVDLSRLVARSSQTIAAFSLVKYKKDGSISDEKTVLCYVSTDNKSLKLKNDNGDLIVLKSDKSLGWTHDTPTKKVKGNTVTDIELLENLIELSSKADSIFIKTIGCDYITICFDVYYKVRARSKSSCSYEVVTCTVKDWIDSIDVYVKTHTKQESIDVINVLIDSVNFDQSEKDQINLEYEDLLTSPITQSIPVVPVTPVQSKTQATQVQSVSI
jgi:hypothetical protein